MVPQHAVRFNSNIHATFGHNRHNVILTDMIDFVRGKLLFSFHHVGMNIKPGSAGSVISFVNIFFPCLIITSAAMVPNRKILWENLHKTFHTICRQAVILQYICSLGAWALLSKVCPFLSILRSPHTCKLMDCIWCASLSVYAAKLL